MEGTVNSGDHSTGGAQGDHQQVKTLVDWALHGDIPLPYDPSRPARAPPSRGPKLGKGGSAQSRLAMLHSLAHTESWAVDLSWDVVARFGAPARMPREFFDDFARVAQDEGRHYTLLSARLGELGSRSRPTTGSGTPPRAHRTACLRASPSSTAYTRMQILTSLSLPKIGLAGECAALCDFTAASL